MAGKERAIKQLLGSRRSATVPWAQPLSLPSVGEMSLARES